MTLSGLSNNNLYLIKTNPSDNTISYSMTGCVESVTVSEDSSDSSTDESDNVLSPVINSIDTIDTSNSVETYLSGVFDDGTKTISRYDNPDVRDFNNNPPELVGDVTSSIVTSSRSVLSTSSDSSTDTDTDSYTDTDIANATKSFYVQDADDDWVEEDATLYAIGDNCYVWIADDNYDDESDSDSDNVVTTTQAQAIADKFDLVYDPETAVFGDKYDEDDAAEGTYLVDPAEKISIFIYDISYDYDEDQSSGTFGFFWAKDFYTDNYMQETYEYRSNETEMFYIDAYFLDKYSDYMYSTLAHEFQHMLHFVHKYIEQGLSSSTWFNEMLSMTCEDMMQDLLEIDDDYSPKSRLWYFNQYYNYGMTDWLDDDGVYISYANAYAFGAYMARNYEGASFVQELASNDSVDMDSITAALSTFGYSDEFDDIFEDWGQALIYTDATDVSDTLSYNKTVEDDTGIYDDYTYPFNAIDLTSDDYNGGGTNNLFSNR
ncbi:MAG: hypothetical protein BKP49_01230 [Treponema sp. CETP13]|nr:MAG: hypothetical protein BKP49_01230 [Treponema sp. CETP13]